MKKYVIYRWTHVETGKSYVGYSSYTCKQRLVGHLKSKTHFGLALRKHGVEAFTSEILETLDSMDKAYEREIFWIAELGTLWPDGYNLRPGGNGNHNKKGDYKLSDITRKALSFAKLGYPISESHKKKISEANKGKKRTKEQRQNISRGLLGNTNYRTVTKEQVRAIREDCTKSIDEWAKELKVHPQNIWSIRTFRTFKNE